MILKRTPEQIIASTYDSVNLINELKGKTQPLSPDDEATMGRNIEHLKIMMVREGFAASLTGAQTKELNLLIA